ncbi:GEVED domain-containing protein [Chryseobacterium koreense]|uniref:GEVED domain-containing protein n=1 Tax=Chryseobacterium koreense CCUG 49689 TaxID=1304281 RepID=A0A0J7IYA2_9FLAO|nr:GEVED domain-containing protein [Chryseobacterium koreense]KMQ70789.1 hypothetical protein ACM44_10800 [Chryseobacterium koreense CCUG 49689]MBB5333689.1 hypothetical protein [Chryseobacterium koreense]
MKKISSIIQKRLLVFSVLLFSLWSLGQNKTDQSILQASAKSVQAIKPVEGNPLEMMKGKTEEISKRDAFSKHFKNADGSMTAVIGAGPIHYSKNGRWEDIDTHIKKNASEDFPYSNTANLMESYFGITSDKGIVSQTKEGKIKEFLNTQMYWEVNGQAVNVQNGSDIPALIKGDKVYYDNLFGTISAEFTVKSGQRKLNYIIPDKQSLGKIPLNADYLVFTEKIKLPDNFKIIDNYKHYNKLKKEYQTIPGIFVIDVDGKVIYEYSAPEIVEDYSSDVMGLPAQMSPEISFEKDGDFINLFIKVKAKWIVDEARTYPIAIDPTATAYPFTANYSSGQTYSSGGGSGNIAAGYSGGWYRGWATFNLTSLPSLSGVTAATISLYINSKGGTMGGAASSINVGHTSFDLSRLVWLSNYNLLYNAITAANNSTGAYNFMPNQNAGTWAAVDLKPGTNTMAIDEIEKKSGNDMAFFPVSFSPSWGTGTTVRYYVIAGYSDPNKPYLTITYTAVDPYKHAAYQYANAGAIGDVGYIQIGNVSIGSINNTTSITNYAANAATIYRNTPTGYNKYNLSTDVYPGTTHTLNTTYRDLGAPYNSGKIAVWVDWNEDGDFADANEYIGISPNTTSGNQIMSFSINVPSTATAGTKRLRIRSFLHDDVVTANDYDKTFEYGETEDYSINVLAVSNPTLTVSQAYSGASYADGTYTLTNNSSVTATSGTRPGYIITGWIGTGSVPATGTGASTTFAITQNSTIDWQWKQTETPNNVKFYNYGGTDQLAFNNSRIETFQPVFRLSHAEYGATDYELEINTFPDFSGTSWTQTFTGIYLANTEINFTFNNAFTPVNGATYYVRARVRGAANVWSTYSTETYSFTYQTPKEIPDWFQTTQAQFLTDALSGVTADGNNDVVTSAGGNMMVNGDFTSGNTNGWTVTGANGAGKTVAVYNNANASYPDNWLGMGSGNTIFQSASGTIVISQQIDLTNVSQISFKGGAYHYVSCCSDPNPNTKLEFKIGGTLTDINGTVGATLAQGNNNRQDKTVNVSSYTGMQVIKFVMTYNSNWNGNGVARFYIDDVVADALPSGTITSTPIHFASVQDATAYKGITWNQTLGDGSLTLKVQQSADGIAGWTDVAGYTNISETGDGKKSFDLSTMPVYPHIRLVGTLNGAGVKMHDWAVEFQKEIPCDKTWTGAVSSDWHAANNWLPFGVPTNKNCVNIPNVANKPIISVAAVALALSLEIQESGNLKIASGAGMNIKKEIINHGDQSNFIIEDTGSLVQEVAVNNIGKITYKRNTSKAWSNDFVYLGSPTKDSQFSRLPFSSGGTMSAYYSWISAPAPAGSPGKWSNAINPNSLMTPAMGYIAKIGNGWTAGNRFPLHFDGVPNNGTITTPFKTGNRQDNPSTPDVDEGLEDKWVLLSNPYPSAIDAEKMLNLQSNKDLLSDSADPSEPYNSDGALYFWAHANGTGAVPNPFYNNGQAYSSNPNNHYVVKNFTGTIPATSTTDISGNPIAGSWNGQIPGAQAFFIRGKANADGLFTFNNEMRSVLDKDTYYRNNQSVNRFWLDFTKKDDNKSAQALIGYIHGATNELDFMYDGLSMGDDLDIYSIAGLKELSIQGRSPNFSNKDVVAIGYSAPQTGAYRIGLFLTEGLFAPHGAQNIYLKDQTSNIVHNLVESPYEFVTDTGHFNDRFEIVYESSTLIANTTPKSPLNIFYDNQLQRWLISSSQQRISKIELYDLSGRLILIKNEINAKEYGIPYVSINQKVAVIKVQTEHAEVLTKKIINPK